MSTSCNVNSKSKTRKKRKNSFIQSHTMFHRSPSCDCPPISKSYNFATFSIISVKKAFKLTSGLDRMSVVNKNKECTNTHIHKRGAVICVLLFVLVWEFITTRKKREIMKQLFYDSQVLVQKKPSKIFKHLRAISWSFYYVIYYINYSTLSK